MIVLQLYNHLNDEYGEEWLDFEPETIRDVVREGDKDELKFNTIMALQTAIKTQSDTDGFYFNDWRVFEKIVLCCVGVVPDFLEIEHVEPQEIHYAYELFQKIKPEVDFSIEVAKYIAASYNEENIVYCPFYTKVDKYLEEDSFKEEVRSLWEKLKDKDIDKISQLEETAEGVQIRRLVYIEEYSKEMLRNA